MTRVKVASIVERAVPSAVLPPAAPSYEIAILAVGISRLSGRTKDALSGIERIHSSWVKYEIAGDNRSLMALCADDIELWPPDAQPLRGRAAVSAQMAREQTKIHFIEITDRRIRGSNEIAYLTASYRTSFSSAEDSTCRRALGSHLWMLQKRAGTWVVTLVSWSVWGSADTSATSQPPLLPSTGVTP